VATIEIDDSLTRNVGITSVDGDPLFEPFADRVTLLPGCHSLAVEVGHAGFYFPSYRGCTKFRIYVEPGKNYLMRENYGRRITVQNVATNNLIGGGSLREMGLLDFCK
jgi:hypothetical protein